MASKNLVSKLQIESMQTVTSFKATEPRQKRRVSVKDPVGSGIFRTSLNLILYYTKVVDEDSGWIFAGWIKESLGRALLEQPMLSGRLRRDEDGHGELEIVSNDSGVRLIEAKIAMTLSEFLCLKESEDVEAELVFWKDVDEQKPQFSPLFYVQVTNFDCGGYSIGISCSILLADILIMEDFLKKWANIHNDLLSEHDGPKTPTFYFPNLKRTNCPPTEPVSSNQRKNCGKTMIFKITDSENVNLENESGRKLMLVCVEEAERELGGSMSTTFPVFLKESSNLMKIKSCTKHGDELIQSELNLRNQVSGANWVDLGCLEVAFVQEEKPASVTNWIGSATDGLVMAAPSSVEATSELNIIVSIPSHKII